MALGPIESWQEFLRRCIGQWDGKYLISSPDVDGLVSAAIIARESNAQLIGLYNTRYLLLFDDYTADQALQALWLDHDINHKQIQCIGQHLVSHHTKDRLPTRNPYCFNPNLYVCQAWEGSFQGVGGRKRDKYPFGTCHMLLHAHDDDPNHFNTRELAMLAHADGTILNRYRYTENCLIWHEAMFGQSKLFALFMSENFAKTGIITEQKQLIDELKKAGVSATKSETKDRELPTECAGLSGSQTVFYAKSHNLDKFLKKLNAVITVLGNGTRFRLPAVSRIGSIVPGHVKKEYPDNISAKTFDEWIRNNHVFSHAFTGQNRLSYTRMDGTAFYE